MRDESRQASLYAGPYCRRGAGRVIGQLAKDMSQDVVFEDGSPKENNIFLL